MTQTQPLPRQQAEDANDDRTRTGPDWPSGGDGIGYGTGWPLAAPLVLGPKKVGRMRAWLIIRGLLGLVLGAMILFQPALSIEAFALLAGVFFVVIGVARIVIGAADSEFSVGMRVLNVAVGVALVAIGAISIRYPGFGLVVTAFLVGFAWMMEGGATLALLPPRHQGRAWAIAFAVVSLLGGALIILWPVESILPLAI
ncbi:MAG: DUF308 domain-containing protein, partial [Bifidobacteriaceae bacterium]|nr:DUF308 domain-containing protein [Bifidobacteriaceae bacterium]